MDAAGRRNSRAHLTIPSSIAQAGTATHHHGSCGGCYDHGVNLCEADEEIRQGKGEVVAAGKEVVCWVHGWMHGRLDA